MKDKHPNKPIFVIGTIRLIYQMLIF